MVEIRDRYCVDVLAKNGVARVTEHSTLPSLETESPIKNPEIINYAEYNKEELSDEFTFYWRVLTNSQVVP